MNARLIKETRDLLPMFAGTLPLIVVPSLIWPAAGIGFVALGVACVVMAGSSFGNEFQHRTLLLLLSQPIARSVLWRDKMRVLGAGMLGSLAALLVCLAVCCPGQDPVQDHGGWVALVLIPLCAFCGTPYWTLLLRHGIGGMVFSVAIPTWILLVTGFVAGQFSETNAAAQAVGQQIASLLLLIYCAFVYWLGYAKFKRLEAVDGPSRELSLSAGLEAVFVRPLTKASSRFRSPFATLLRKELRLQQTSFLLAGLFFLVAVAGACVVKYRRELAEAIVGFDCMIYVVILPLIAGAVSVAEERGWGMAEWHLTLPPSALKQWSAIMLAALSTSLALGLLLPTALWLAVVPLFNHPGAGDSLPPASEIPGWIFLQLLVTSAAVYAASFSKSTLRAILAAFAIIAVGVGASALVSWGWADEAAPRLVLWTGRPHMKPCLVLPVLSGALGFMLCLIQWFAWSNFRRGEPSTLRLLVQFAVILLSVSLVALFVCTAQWVS